MRPRCRKSLCEVPSRLNAVLVKLGSEGWLLGNQIHHKLLLHESSLFRVYYAPYEINRSKAELAGTLVYFVGLTPGRRQAFAAFQNFYEPAGSLANDPISYLGSMRSNLIRMLDQLALNRALGLNSCRSLFQSRRSLITTTSLLRFPVFTGREEKNYSGFPPPEKDEFLNRMMNEIFVPELRNIPRQALIIPFGKAVNQSLLRLALEKKLPNPGRVLWGFPHPSGANNGKISQYLADPPETHRRLIAHFKNHLIRSGLILPAGGP